MTTLSTKSNTSPAPSQSVTVPWVNPPSRHGEVLIGFARITPTWASAMLTRCPEHKQRPISKNRLRTYAEDMGSGRWALSMDCVAIDSDGDLVNARHRLAAVARSGMTIVMPVMYGVNAETVFNADSGRARSHADAKRIAGMGETAKKLSACARFMYCVGRGNSDVSRKALYDYENKYADEIAFACSVLAAALRCPRPLTALVARAAVTENRDRLREFGEVVSTGMPVSTNREDDTAAVVLRSYMLTNSSYGSVGERTTYRKASRALMAFLRRQPITKLYEANSELWPLPDDAASPE